MSVWSFAVDAVHGGEDLQASQVQYTFNKWCVVPADANKSYDTTVQEAFYACDLLTEVEELAETSHDAVLIGGSSYGGLVALVENYGVG